MNIHPQSTTATARPCIFMAWLVCLLLSLVLPAALLADTYLVPGTNIMLTYTVSGSPATATITDCNYDATGTLAIPATLGGVPVTSIGDHAFYDCTSLTSVSIPASVTSIGDYAFAYTSLTSVSIPASVTSIGDGSFIDCTSLTSVTIPSSLTSIGEWAFSDCTSLTSVTFPASVTSIGYGAFSGCTSLTSIDVATANPNYASISGVLFDKNILTLLQAPGALSSAYTIPSSVTSLGEWAFSDCANLTSVTIPASVTSIGNYAFYGCTGLTGATIPASVTSIRFGAFSGCTSLTSITILSSVTSIDNYAFEDCTSLTSFTIPASVTSIGYGAFSGCTSLTSIDVATANPNYASISGVLFDKNFRTLLQAPGALSSAYTIPSSVTSLGAYAFSGCSSLTSLTIPASVTSIDEWAFSGCSSLTSVSIPSSVTSIDYGAFYGCTSLTSVTFAGNAPVSFGGSVFSSVAPGFVINYPLWATGFTSPTWQGYPALPYDDGRTAQTITFDQPADRVLGDAPFNLSASASSGLPVTFTVFSGPATVSGSTLTLTGTGTVTIEATQQGNDTYSSAPSVQRSFTVSRSGQTITFPTIADKPASAPAFDLSATASSGLPVTFTVVSGPATLSGATLTLTGGGTVTIRATQAGNDNFSAAPAIEHTFFVHAGTAQTLAFSPLPARLVKTKFTLAATATSGLPVTFSIVSGPATLGPDGKTLILGTTAGTVVIRATQAGGTRNGVTYAPVSIERSFEVVLKAPATAQTITFAQPATLSYGAAASLVLTANASSGLPVSFELVSGPATLAADGFTLLPTAPGKVVVRAVQLGDATFKSAAAVLRTIHILPAAPALPATHSRTVSGRVDLDLHGINPTTGVTYSAKGLPAGLKLDAKTGLLSGVITGKPGSYSITAYATAAGLKSAPATCTFTVTAFPAAWASTATGTTPVAWEGLLVTPHATVPYLDLPVGKLTLLTTASGAFTGTLITPLPKAYAIKGQWQVAPDGHSATASLTLATRAKTGAYQLDLGLTLPEVSLATGADPVPLAATLLQLATPGTTPPESTPAILGQLQNPVRLAAFTGKGTSLAPWRGTYNATLTTQPELNLDPASPVRALPADPGSATLTVASTGVLSAKGKLGDGTPWTATLAPDASAAYRCFAQPYTTAGNYLAGDLGFSPDTTFSALARYQIDPESTELLWHKPANAKDKSRPDGFGPVGIALAATSTKDPFVGNFAATFADSDNIRSTLTTDFSINYFKVTFKIQKSSSTAYTIHYLTPRKGSLNLTNDGGVLRPAVRPLEFDTWNLLDFPVLSDGVNQVLAHIGQEKDQADDIAFLLTCWSTSTAKPTPAALVGTYSLSGRTDTSLLDAATGFVPDSPGNLIIAATSTPGQLRLTLPGGGEVLASLSGNTATATGLPLNLPTARIHALKFVTDGAGHLALYAVFTKLDDPTAVSVSLLLGVRN